MKKLVDPATCHVRVTDSATRAEFVLGPNAILRCYLTKDGTLVINCSSGALVIEPRVANEIEIRAKQL